MWPAGVRVRLPPRALRRKRGRTRARVRSDEDARVAKRKTQHAQLVWPIGMRVRLPPRVLREAERTPTRAKYDDLIRAARPGGETEDAARRARVASRREGSTPSPGTPRGREKAPTRAKYDDLNRRARPGGETEDAARLVRVAHRREGSTPSPGIPKSAGSDAARVAKLADAARLNRVVRRT